MAALIIGIAALLLTGVLVLPFGLGWWHDVLVFIRGALPVFSLFIGIVSIFIGIADLKDRYDAKKEDAEDIKAAQSAVEKDEED